MSQPGVALDSAEAGGGSCVSMLACRTEDCADYYGWHAELGGEGAESSPLSPLSGSHAPWLTKSPADDAERSAVSELLQHISFGGGCDFADEKRSQ